MRAQSSNVPVEHMLNGKQNEEKWWLNFNGWIVIVVGFIALYPKWAKLEIFYVLSLENISKRKTWVYGSAVDGAIGLGMRVIFI